MLISIISGRILVFQSPKTGLCFSHRMLISIISGRILVFQSPKTGLCFSHSRI